MKLETWVRDHMHAFIEEAAAPQQNEGPDARKEDTAFLYQKKYEEHIRNALEQGRFHDAKQEFNRLKEHFLSIPDVYGEERKHLYRVLQDCYKLIFDHVSEKQKTAKILKTLTYNADVFDERVAPVEIEGSKKKKEEKPVVARVIHEHTGSVPSALTEESLYASIRGPQQTPPAPSQPGFTSMPQPAPAAKPTPPPAPQPKVQAPAPQPAPKPHVPKPKFSAPAVKPQMISAAKPRPASPVSMEKPKPNLTRVQGIKKTVRTPPKPHWKAPKGVSTGESQLRTKPKGRMRPSIDHTDVPQPKWAPPGTELVIRKPKRTRKRLSKIPGT